MSISVLVGQHLTAGELPLLSIGPVRLWIGGVYALIFAVFYGASPRHRSGSTAWVPILPDLRKCVPAPPSSLFYCGLLYLRCLADRLRVRDQGCWDTLFVFSSSIVIGVSVVGFGYYVGKWLDGGLYWWWFIITVWVMVMAIVFSARYFQGNGKTMRVIEPELRRIGFATNTSLVVVPISTFRRCGKMLDIMCPSCEKAYRLPEHRGKHVRCQQCGLTFVAEPSDTNEEPLLLTNSPFQSTGLRWICGHPLRRQFRASHPLLARGLPTKIDYEIRGDDMQFVEITLDPGECVIAKPARLMCHDGRYRDANGFRESIQTWQ